MTKYVSQKQAHERLVLLRQARRKLKIAIPALEEIAAAMPCESPGCACCSDLTNHDSWEEHCDVGNAKVALKLIKEVKA